MGGCEEISCLNLHRFQGFLKILSDSSQFPQTIFLLNVYFQKDRVEQVFGVKLTIEKLSGFAKPGMPADTEILFPENE
jgi:hypothetical protein